MGIHAGFGDASGVLVILIDDQPSAAADGSGEWPQPVVQGGAGRDLRECGAVNPEELQFQQPVVFQDSHLDISTAQGQPRQCCNACRTRSQMKVEG